MTRTVLDTNAIVSTLLFNDSAPGRALIRALDTGAILVSATLAQELQDVLNRLGLTGTLPERSATSS